ncbi:RING-H2 finger protein ATL47 [Spatholobus suberectus]|nr:RING-H2 finger protein ATL47 [Spatholobus suberectus]
MLTKYLTLIYTHLKWVLDFLLYYPFFMLHDSQPPINIEEELSAFHYEFTSGSEEYVDCAVCLRKIGEGDGEIRVLRCEHVFHKGCLDRWVGFKNATCPLCRGSVGSTGPLTHSGAEVLFFQFCSFQKPNRETWWLR